MLIIQIAVGIVLGFVFLSLIQTEEFWGCFGVVFLIFVGIALIGGLVLGINALTNSGNGKSLSNSDQTISTPSVAGNQSVTKRAAETPLSWPDIVALDAILILVGILCYISVNRKTS